MQAVLVSWKSTNPDHQHSPRVKPNLYRFFFLLQIVLDLAFPNLKNIAL